MLRPARLQSDNDGDCDDGKVQNRFATTPMTTATTTTSISRWRQPRLARSRHAFGARVKCGVRRPQSMCPEAAARWLCLCTRDDGDYHTHPSRTRNGHKHRTEMAHIRTEMGSLFTCMHHMYVHVHECIINAQPIVSSRPSSSRFASRVCHARVERISCI